MIVGLSRKVVGLALGGVLAVACLSVAAVATALVSETVAGSPAYADEWKSDASGWWYSRDDGSYPADCWREIDGTQYLFDADGYMHAGWALVDDEWYYLAQSGSLVTGWKYLGGAWYYLDPAHNGAMVTGWNLIDNEWYCFNADGSMRTGWVFSGGSWYYLSQSGAMVTSWCSIGGLWYYLSPEQGGAMAVGWLNLDDTWYYLKESGAMAANYWAGDYYLDASGRMATDTHIGVYYVGIDGKWIPNYDYITTVTMTAKLHTGETIVQQVVVGNDETVEQKVEAFKQQLSAGYTDLDVAVSRPVVQHVEGGWYPYVPDCYGWLSLEAKPKSEAERQQKINAIIELAKSLQGTPYVWGGHTPEGFDCSGFVQYCFRNAADYYLQPNAEMQSYCVMKVSFNELQPGDLLFWKSDDSDDSNESVYHVGMYIGNWQYIDSNTGEGVGVRINSMNYFTPSFAGRAF